MPPPAPGGSRYPLACGRVILIPASVLTSSVALPVCFNFPLSLTRTLVIGLRAHSDNPGGPHLETLILMTSAENLTPNPVTFLDSKWMSIWGATIEPIASLRLPFPWQQEEQTELPRGQGSLLHLFRPPGAPLEGRQHKHMGHCPVKGVLRATQSMGETQPSPHTSTHKAAASGKAFPTCHSPPALVTSPGSEEGEQVRQFGHLLKLTLGKKGRITIF